MKRIIAVTLALVIALMSYAPCFAMSEDDWDKYWETDEAHSGITLFPGSDESERRVSWYSEKESKPFVELTADGMKNPRVFHGECVETYSGDFANKVTVTGLEEGKDYTYVCVSGDYRSDEYTFNTSRGSDFTALYVADIHISEGEDEEGDSIRYDSYLYGEVIEAAGKISDIDIVLSAGDQASRGLESEYKGLSASPAGRGITFAPAIGNHDRKGVDFRTFKNLPNEKKGGINTTYIGFDYWFVKGDTLFMVLESNNGSGIDHHAFMEAAVRANKEVKWRVCMMHHDLYSGRIPSRESENELLRLIWGPMFSEFAIDLVLLGHSHYYSVSDVLFNNKITAEIKGNDDITDAPGTVSIVSGSINHPRSGNEEEVPANDTLGYYYDNQGGQVLYNIIDFSSDSITVRSYSYDTGEQFNSLTLRKTSPSGGHPAKRVPLYQPMINLAGTVYQFFNNISVRQRLKDSGFEISLFDILFKGNR
ncbi:MAG: metallophosphoesterase [Clostridia bacterium]|nr:metallophosphoesterase [Clostridia bacterium]